MFPGLNPANFDPSKLDPKLIGEISELMRTLPHDQIMKMQTIMHNSMAGFDVTKEVREFESSLPPAFREKLARIMYQANAVDMTGGSSATISSSEPAPALNSVDEARLTVLRGVRSGSISPEDALKALFP